MQITQQIEDRSKEIEDNCLISPPELAPGEKPPKAEIKPEKLSDSTCALFIAHGPAMTKITQRYMIDRLGDEWEQCKIVSFH